jgi:hypothetical protein
LEKDVEKARYETHMKYLKETGRLKDEVNMVPVSSAGSSFWHIWRR